MTTEPRQYVHPKSGPGKHVVILGGGFGGLYAAKGLAGAECRVTVIDKRNFHLFQPLLYQVATGGLSPGDIAAPLRAALRDHHNTQVLLDEAVDLDAPGRKLILKDGWIQYDFLIAAAGATHSYFGKPAWAGLAPGLKTLEDATEIRSRMLYAFEAAEKEPDPEIRGQWLTFVIVGGGPTGVELAGALGEIANETIRGDFRRIRPEESQILLLDAGSRILSSYAEELSMDAERALIALNVRTRNGVRVTAIDETGVALQTARGSERIGARTVLWAAGVQASPFAKVLAAQAGATLDRAGRILVSPDLTVPGHPEIFVVGDMASVEQDGQPIPGVAPAAMQMGRYVANRITGRGEAKPFRYVDKGSLAVIGRASAVAQFGDTHFKGYLAWLLWLFIHLMYLVGFQNRVLVFVQWAFHYLTFSRGARIISSGRSSPGTPARPGS